MGPSVQTLSQLRDAAPRCCSCRIHQSHCWGCRGERKGWRCEVTESFQGQRGSFLVTQRTRGFVLPVALHALYDLLPPACPRPVINALFFSCWKTAAKKPFIPLTPGIILAQLMYSPVLDSPRCAAAQDQGKDAGALLALSQLCPSKPQQGREAEMSPLPAQPSHPALPVHRAPCPSSAPSGPEITVSGGAVAVAGPHGSLQSRCARRPSPAHVGFTPPLCGDTSLGPARW